MKKNWILGMAVCGILSVSDSAYGQSIKDILNSAAVKDAVTTVTGGKEAEGLLCENRNHRRGIQLYV